LVASPALVTTLRASLRLALAAGLAIAMVVWSGRSDRVFLALITVVLYVSDSRPQPWRLLVRQFAGAVVGILTALVLFQLADGWLMLSIVLLVVALLIEALQLQAGRSLALLLAWGVLEMDLTRAFNIATVFDLVLVFVIGLVSARVATVLVWPERPGLRIRMLDQTIYAHLHTQIGGVRHWLQQGGPSPKPLLSAQLLPAVLELEQSPARQLGLLWRLIMRQWLLLEPQLLALPAPLTHPAGLLLLQRLEQIAAALSDPHAAQPSPVVLLPEPTPWPTDTISRLIAMAIEQQLNTLDQLLHSQGLLRRSDRWQRRAG
jgi:hypothetical protein